MSTLISFDMQPGIFSESSGRADVNRWKDGNNVRFFEGYAEKFGGGVKQIATTFLGVCRAMLAWTTLTFSRYIALGTSSRLYLTDLVGYYDITPVRESGNLTNPFTTTNGSVSVSVADTDHGNNTGDTVIFSGATAVGGLTLNGEYVITAVPSDDTYLISAATPATSGATGGGTVAYKYLIYAGNVDSLAQAGWGIGSWGLGTWGNGIKSTRLQIARIWSLANWGEDLLASPVDGPIYVWTASSGTNARATLIAAAPIKNRVVLVSPQIRIAISLGSHDGTSPDPMLIRWSDSEDYTDWTPTVSNLAGDKRLDKGSEIIGARLTRNGIAIFTDQTVYSMTLSGDNLVFSFDDAGDAVGLASPNAAVDVDGTMYAFGRGQFFTYDGQLTLLPCDVYSKVFGDLNVMQAAKIYCARNKSKNEVIWFFPSAASQECDRCVGFNHVEKTWWLGTLARTAWLDETPFGQQPYAVSPTGQLYVQETGVDDGDVALPYSLESYDLEIGAFNSSLTGNGQGPGEIVFQINSLIPDFKRIAGRHYAKLTGYKYPNDQHPLTRPGRPFYPGKPKIDGHLRARQISMMLYSTALGTDFRLGQWRADIAKLGKR